MDAGATSCKPGIFGPALGKRAEASRAYDVHVYAGVSTDIEPEGSIAWLRLKQEK
jgi:hypothetical protein